MEENIRYVEKPDNISWEQIRECIYLAQQTNIKKGFDMCFGHYTSKQIEDEIEDGVCFVALNEENKVVGTCSYKISSIKRWWCKGRSAYLCLAGVLPDYQGKKIYSTLCKMRDTYIKERGDINTIWFSTAEKNYSVQQKHKKSGFKIVQYSPSCNGATYYSVIMANWLYTPPFFYYFFSLFYFLSIIIVKLIYKPGKIRRF